MATLADRARGRKRLNERLEGRRYGLLTVMRYGGQHRTTGSKPRWVNVWLCRCDCGSEVTIREQPLKDGRTKSCGCLRRTLRAGGLPAERLAGKMRGIYGRRLREEEAVLWRPFRDLLGELMGRKAIPEGLLRMRWPREERGLREILDRVAARVPSEDEAVDLMVALDLRGMDRERFLGAARRARELVTAYRAGKPEVVAMVSGGVTPA